MKIKHTPSPWWPTDYGIRDRGGYIAHTRSVQRYEGQDERYAHEVSQREADKLLIAAAPDLLEALQFVMSAHGEQLETAFEQAQYAIFKATGDTNEK